ncbi:hypothetical protein [Marinobacter orientalis]|uniref:Uncharacterized protein n=1 Tax=Marinobacter orientalis TaxID=1928859 RepID=A0A7Y0RC07_9GAMM|nr:hypothetical protein [Marinobacter orientalis]NMT63452.1 hypothetical protein [Marinobacter orientalis]
MLEVLTYAALARNEEIAARLQVEPKLYGYSGAGHKVEFIVNKEARYDDFKKPEIISGGGISDPVGVIAFIECKKVGVEQTINKSFKKKYKKNGSYKNYVIPFGEEIKIKFQGSSKAYSIFFLDEGSGPTINITENGNLIIKDDVVTDYRLIFPLYEDGSVGVIKNDGSLRDHQKTLKSCKILEIYGSNEFGGLALLNDCLSGPQTPEKAKQSSFVALDVRKKRYDSFDINENEEDLVSILVLTEFSHWEEKSQNIIKACIDVNLVVADSIIVQAFKVFEEKFGSDFYSMIKKDNLLNDDMVRSIAFEIVDEYEGKIFRDIKDGQLKKFAIIDGKLKIIS